MQLVVVPQLNSMVPDVIAMSLVTHVTLPADVLKTTEHGTP
jgi:hypothetical protein